jgi:squalene synthase HpnC
VTLARRTTPAASGALPHAETLAAPVILAKARHENFPVALRFLPGRLRRRLEAIYGFARLVDDAGDEAQTDRVALLDWLEADLHRAFAGDARHPLMQRLTPLVRELSLTPDPFLRLIEANRRDQRVARYATWDELAEYCTFSANPVGELVLESVHAATPERVRLSDDVCTALQLAEHLQDVGEDLERGRVYVPAEDLERFGVTDLRAPLPHELVAFEVDRGRTLLASGPPLVASLRGGGRIAVAAYVGGGVAAFAALERGGRFAGKRARLAATLHVLREAGHAAR